MVVNIINIRSIRVYRFTPAELLLGFNPSYLLIDLLLDELVRAEIVRAHIEQNYDQLPEIPPQFIEAANLEVRLIKLDEMRIAAMDNVIKYQEKIVKKQPRFKSPKTGDLVLKRRISQDV